VVADKLKFLRIHPHAKLPSRATPFSAGLDLYSVEDISIEANMWAACKTGVAIIIPNGYYGRISPRSGLAIQHGVDVLAGVIDSDYRGEIICILINHGNSPVHFEEGDRIAQIVIEAIATLEPEWVDELDETDRSSKGFGSSGS
jgi:dUTP pyrophosphatase